MNETVASDILEAAMLADDTKVMAKPVAQDDSLHYLDRCHAETLVLYSPVGAPGIRFDGNHSSTSIMLLLPASRGRITMSSSSATDPPAVDPNYYATNVVALL